MQSLATRDSINALYSHLFHSDTHVQLEIQEIIMIALSTCKADVHKEYDTVQYIARKLIATLTRSMKGDDTTSFYLTMVSLKQAYDEDLPRNIGSVAGFISRFLQKECFVQAGEFLIDSQLHLLLFDSIVAATQIHNQSMDEKLIRNASMVTMLKESAHCLRVCSVSLYSNSMHLTTSASSQLTIIN